VPHIFDRFWRAPGAPEGGTGLGLSIAAWIVERHGGTIAVEPRSPNGTRFLIRLPMADGRQPGTLTPVVHTGS
jgi:signal transduction histidine kinase